MIKRYKKVIKVSKRIGWKKPLLLGIIFPVVLLIILCGFLYFTIIKELPSPSGLSKTAQSYSTQIYDRNGTLLYTIYGNRNQTFVPLSRIPKGLQEATIAIEDQNFYNEGAIDVKGILRAAYVDLIAHGSLQGGSTITQQLVKNSLLTNQQTITRKIKEVFLSFLTTVSYPKSKILEMYLNQVPYGGTAYGVEAASETFFGKHVQDLTLAEEAYLAGLPQEPSTYSPTGSSPELGIQRQQQVLQKMYQLGYINKKQLNQALAEKLQFAKITNPILAPHFVFYVKDLLEKQFGVNLVEGGGLKVYTSLDLNIQNYAQAEVTTQIAGLTAYHIGNGGALVTDPATGEILAMVGSKNFFDPNGGNVNVTLAQLQPGSSIKPINYAVGLMNGYSAATPFIDEPICFPEIGQPSYCPTNYDHSWHGVVSMRTALGNSINIPAVEMLRLNGIPAMLATASAMGIQNLQSPDHYGLSLTLGGVDVTMTDMATAYGVFANQGYRVDLHPILKVVDRNGNILEQYKPPSSPIFGKRVLPSDVTWIISNILADNNARLIDFGPDSGLVIPGQYVPVKTGTTDDFRDNWTIGYTPSYLVAVWVGNNDHSPMSAIASGITGAAPIWHDIMVYLLKNKKPEIPQKPPDVFQKYVCDTTGLLPTSPNSCPTYLEYLINGAEPKSPDITQEKVFIDKTTNALAAPGQTANVVQQNETMMTDVMGNRYCLTCAHPSPTPTPTPKP